MPRFLCQRAMKGDNVAPGEQVIQGHIFDTAALYRETVIGNDMHPKAPADVNEYPPDFARADHAHGLPVKVESRQPVQGKVKLPRPVICLVDAADGG